MRKKWICILSGLLAFVLVGCSTFATNEDAKFYTSVEGENLQGVKEVVRDKKLNLEKMPRVWFSNFTKNDRRALGIAIGYGGNVNAEIVRAIIDAGADVNHSVDGYTYLMGTEADYEICKILIDAGADVTVVNKEKKDALLVLLGIAADEYAGENDEVWKCVQLFREHGAQINKRAVKAILERDDYYHGAEIIQDLYKEKKSTGISKGLEYAITGENDKLLSYLDKHDISEKEKKYFLLQASAHCNVEVLKRLKQKGYDFSVRDESKQTMLHIAAKYNNAEVVSYLISEGMKLEKVTDFCQITPLTSAVIGGKNENVSVLLKAGAKWQQSKDWGDTASTWESACAAGTAESVNLLLKNEYVPTKQEIVRGYREANDETFSALLENNIPYDIHYVEWGEESTIFDQLCIFKPKLALKLYQKDSTLSVSPYTWSWICDGDIPELVKCLIDNTKDLDENPKICPLMDAIGYGQMELVQYLVERGADINFKFDDGESGYYTPMHMAASSPSRDILEYLIEHGGDTKIKDSDGKTPYDYAKEYKWKENMELLK